MYTYITMQVIITLMSNVMLPYINTFMALYEFVAIVHYITVYLTTCASYTCMSKTVCHTMHWICCSA